MMDKHFVGNIVFFSYCVLLVAFLFYYYRNWMYKYGVKDGFLTVKYNFVFTLIKADVKDILAVEIVGIGDIYKGGFFTLFCINRFWGKYLLIKNRNGLMRYIVISPDDVVSFYDMLSKNIKNP